MKKLILGIFILLFIGGAIFAFTKYSQKNKKLKAEELFWQGRQASSDKNDLKALDLLSKAVAQSPENAEFNFWAGIAARDMGKNDLAYSYFKKSWDIGKKEPQVFLNMNATSSLPNIDRSLFFESMVGDLADEEARLELGALLKYQREELEGAAQLLKELVAKYPQGIYAEFYAQVLIRLKEPEQALKMLESIRAAGKLNNSSYTILSELYVAIDDMKAANELFEEAKSTGMDSAQLILGYGSSLFYYGNSEISKKLLSQIEQPKIFSATDIISADIFKKELSNGSPIAKIFLETANPALKDALKSEKSDRFSNQKFIELSVIALNKFCSRRDWFTKELTNGSLNNKEIQKLSSKAELTDQDNFTRNALLLTAAFPDSLQVPDLSPITSSSRLLLMVMASAANNKNEVDRLLSLSKGSRRWLEGERYFGAYLLETLSNQGTSEQAIKSLEAASTLLTDNNIIQVTLADNLARQGDYLDALVLFDKMSSNSLILARSPIVQQMRSSAKIASGDLKGGQAILLSLFKRGYITEALLSELSQVSLALGDTSSANLAIEKLQEYAATKPSLHLLAARVLLQSNKIPAAISELDKLIQSDVTPELKAEAFILKATAELSAGNADEALRTLASLPEATLPSRIIEAQALSKLGKSEEAIAILEKLSPLPENALSLYATLLAGIGKLDQAQVQIDKILAINPSNVDALLNLGLIMNIKGDINGAISEINKALEISPDNIRGNTLLSQILLSTGEPRRAANLALKVLSIAPNYQVALELLPSAYNANKEYLKAITSSDKALKNSPNNPFIIMQKAIALVGLSEEVAREDREAKNKSRKNLDSSTSTEDELLKDEVTSLTDDIVYTGAISELDNSSAAVEDSSATEFANGRDSKELKEEAITLLDTISDQPAALVYKLEIELMLGEKENVIKSINSGKLETNELFSLGVISDGRKDWEVSSAAYRAAYTLQPTNPIILNNFANAFVMSGKSPNEATKKLLLEAADSLPVVLKGDEKAVNTSAMIYEFLGEWEKTIELSEAYKEQFKASPKLKRLLNAAQIQRESSQNKEENSKKDASPEPSKG